MWAWPSWYSWGWLIAPGPWLAAMLALSVYHFGSDDDDPRRLRGLAR